MPGLIRRRLLRGDDRGGVMVIVAVLLAGGVLMGSGALAVDVGRLYVEREQLQSGADGAAMAVARECADAVTSCGADPDGTAKGYADSNAEDDVSGVNVLCGDTPSGALPACPPSSTTLSRCMTEPPDDVPYVEVRTRTETDGGSTLLPPTFAQLMLGNEGYDGSTVGACARAAWGPPASAGGLAVTISSCEWSASTGGGTSFADPPPYPPNPLPPGSVEQIIYLHNTTGATTCPAGPSGWDAPGGFGWLDDEGGCTATIEADGTYSGNTGVSVSGACKTAMHDAWADHRVIFMPVYDGVSGTGAGTTYHIKGMAAFVLTGYDLPGFSEKSWLTGEKLCKGSDKCLYGYFTQALVPATGVIGGPDLGASIVALVG